MNCNTCGMPLVSGITHVCHGVPYTPPGDGAQTPPPPSITIPNTLPFWIDLAPHAAAPNVAPNATATQIQAGNGTGFIYVSLADIERMLERVVQSALESNMDKLIDRLIERVKKEDL